MSNADDVRVAAYLAKADELAADMETHGYGVVQTYCLLAIAHMMAATRGELVDGPLRCDNCGKTMAEHGKLAECWPAHSDDDGCD